MSLAGTYKRESIIDNSQYIDLFVSDNKTKITKLVLYSPIKDREINNKKRKLFNFGFGDLDTETGTLLDSVLSDNGDARKVFLTVLSSVPEFFLKEPEDILRVGGSDSTKEFLENCMAGCDREYCKKNGCRKKDRRIKRYQNYVDDNYDQLSKDYNFFGGINVNQQNDTYDIVDYVPHTDYTYVLIGKK